MAAGIFTLVEWVICGQVEVYKTGIWTNILQTIPIFVKMQHHITSPTSPHNKAGKLNSVFWKFKKSAQIGEAPQSQMNRRESRYTPYWIGSFICCCQAKIWWRAVYLLWRQQIYTAIRPLCFFMAAKYQDGAVSRTLNHVSSSSRQWQLGDSECTNCGQIHLFFGLAHID